MVEINICKKIRAINFHFTIPRMIALCVVIASRIELLNPINMCSWPMMNKPKIAKNLSPSKGFRIHIGPKYLSSCLLIKYMKVDKLISISIDVCTNEKITTKVTQNNSYFCNWSSSVFNFQILQLVGLGHGAR